MTALETGTYAPDFDLYGIYKGNREIFRLSKELSRGKNVLLMFYPMDFSPVCTAELCSIRDTQWFEEFSDLSIWGISGDSLYCHQQFASTYSLNYPILTDSGGEVAERYGVKYDWWDGHVDVPKRAFFLINEEQVIEYSWHSDNAYLEPDFNPVREVVSRIATLKDMDIDIPEESVEVSYGEHGVSQID